MTNFHRAASGPSEVGRHRGKRARCGERPRAAVSLFLAVVLAVLPVVPQHNGGEARAEILVLKADGERIPCKVLFKDGEKIIVRVGVGTERTLAMSEVAEILPDTSNVEVYEGVAEAMPSSGGIVPYYLGVWCLKNGLPQNGRRLLERTAGLRRAEGATAPQAGDRSVAALRGQRRGPDCAARAKLALAGTLKGAGRRHGEQRALLLAAVMADPTLEEAVEALSGQEHELVEIPRSILMGLVRAIDNVRAGAYKSAYEKLLSIKKKAGPEVLQAVSSRLTTAAGLGFEEFMARCGEGLDPKLLAGGDDSGGPERTDCKNCRGRGFVRCEVCNGRGYMACKKCQGRGVVTSTRRRSDTGKMRSVAKKCTTCSARGYRACVICLRMPKGSLDIPVKSKQVAEPCRKCNGTGRIATRQRVVTVYGVCRDCGGKGTRERTVKMTRATSGWRRCPLCNKDGKIPFEGPPGLHTRTTRRTTRPAASSTSTTGRSPAERKFTDAELQRMRQFAALLMSVTGGGADYLWCAGDKVPLGLARSAGGLQAERSAAGDGKETVFVGGRWVTPSTARLIRQRMKMLKYEPRKPDLGPFVKWLQDEEVAFLRGHSVDIGAGQDPAASILGIASHFERAQGANYRDAFDGAQVFRTVFLPDSEARREGVACRWKVGRSRGREAVTLVLLRDPGRWPGLEMVLTPAPGDGLDMNGLGKDLVSHSRQPLTLYYRVASCRRSSKGRGDDAVSHVALDVRVVAAIVGPERRPKEVWIHGVEALTQSVAGR